MNVYFDFLLKASVSISIMYVLYWLLLRNMTHFKANRYFLIVSVILAIVCAAFPLRYEVLIAAPQALQSSEFTDQFQRNISSTMVHQKKAFNINIWSIAWGLYVLGLLFVLLRLIIQSWKPIQIIYKTTPKKVEDCLLHENTIYKMPFSFFNRILIHPEYFKQNDINDILTHEKVHIQERHWIDLFIIELLTVLFWFNPFIWLFERAIKQNHEYLADKGVLSRGQSPVRYQALLINQLMGTKVIGLANNLNFALGPTRFKMMTKEKTSKRKLYRMIWGIPVLAILLVAFAEPEYKIKADKEIQTASIYYNKQFGKNIPVKIKGTVKDNNGNPMTGASVIVQGTTNGTVAGKNGTYEIELPYEGKFSIVVSFVGYETVVNTISIKSTSPSNWRHDFIMKREVITINYKEIMNIGDVPSSPSAPKAPEFDKNSDKPVFIVVEDMPKYKQGFYGLAHYVKRQKSQLQQKSGTKLKGKATLGFTINTLGEVTNIQILKKSNDMAAKAAKIIATEMENWKPGSQRGKNVAVDYAMELEF